MTDTTSPQLQRAVIPWSRPDWLPPLSDGCEGDPSLLRPAVPIVLLSEDTGRGTELQLQADTGLSQTVIVMAAARALGLEGLAPAGAVEFPLKDQVLDVAACRLPAVIAGRWNVEITARFVEAGPEVFGGPGLLGRDVLDSFITTFDGPGRTLTLEREGG